MASKPERRATTPGVRTIRYVHWNAAEALDRGARIQSLAPQCEVISEPRIDPPSLAELRKALPAVLIIDLSRLPSHGRAVAQGLRESRTSRNLPILFLEGLPDKVAIARRAFPDAFFATWDTLGQTLATALAVAPGTEFLKAQRCAISGEAKSKPLAAKLGVKAGRPVWLAGAPEDFESKLGDLPDGATVTRRRPAGECLTLWFVRNLAELAKGLDSKKVQAGTGGLWVIWPKQASTFAGDLKEGDVRESCLRAGLVDFKVCAVDADWSGLRFAPARKSASTTP